MCTKACGFCGGSCYGTSPFAKVTLSKYRACDPNLPTQHERVAGRSPARPRGGDVAPLAQARTLERRTPVLRANQTRNQLRDFSSCGNHQAASRVRQENPGNVTLQANPGVHRRNRELCAYPCCPRAVRDTWMLYSGLVRLRASWWQRLRRGEARTYRDAQPSAPANCGHAQLWLPPCRRLGNPPVRELGTPRVPAANRLALVKTQAALLPMARRQRQQARRPASRITVAHIELR